MGAGVKGGANHGATNEFGRRAAEQAATVWDLCAALLHPLGFDRA